LYSANETDRVGDQGEGSVSAFAVNRQTGGLELLNTVRAGGGGADLCQPASGGETLAGGELLRRLDRGPADYRRRAPRPRQ
ncbi:MAG: hypothetical protein ACKO3P_02595, partial [Planctomycetaceae bacterium]